jgi:hypothetical protein
MVDNKIKSAAQNAEKTKESLEAEKISKLEESKQIKEAKKESGKEAASIIEGLEAAEEGAEFAEGKVSEKTREGKRVGPSGAGAFGVSYDIKDIILPTIEVMRVQISTKIKTEIKRLEKEAKSIRRSPKFDPFRFSEVIGRLRYLKDILARLASITAESCKDLWLKFVKGITSQG